MGELSAAGSGLNICFRHRHPTGAEVQADFVAEPGITVLLGPSGSGKSTVLRVVCGLLRPAEGRIALGAATWMEAAVGLHLPPGKREVGWVPQEGLLFPHLSVAGNLAFSGASPSETGRLLDLVGLTPFAHRRPASLSGGQRQRASLARALAASPKVLLLDEPLSSLDRPEQERLRRELGALLRQLELPCLWVTHDREEALAVGDHAVVLLEGRQAQAGTLAEVFDRPASPEVARFLGLENLWRGEVVARSGALAEVSVNGLRLWAMDPGEGVTAVWVALRAEDVILEAPPGSPTSARNRLEATVREVRSEGGLVEARLALPGGLALTARITRPAVEALGLKEGAAVLALFKAQALHLIPCA